MCVVLVSEHKFLHALETMYQQGATASTLERRDRSSLLGSYTSVTPGQREAYLLKVRMAHPPPPARATTAACGSTHGWLGS